MSCATPFDWARQSNEHRLYTLTHYPLLYELQAEAGDYQEFAQRVNALNPSMRVRYTREYNQWFKEFGRVWDRIGCLPENTVGEHTNAYSFSDNPPTTRPYLTGSLSGLGATGDMPSLPSGYNWCDSPAVGGNPASTERNVDGMFGWTYQIWAGGDDKLYYRYYDQMTNMEYWACPPTTSVVSNRTEVKKIQSALLSKGYNPGTIDGIWGPNTCQAAYSFQRNEMKEYGSSLTSQFFFALGVSGLGTKYARACDKWYTGDLGPDPDYVPAPTPLEVKRALLSLGYDVGPLTNVWDSYVCKAAFAFKKTALGETDTVLGKNFFEKLGFKGTLEVRDCQKYATAPVKPKPTVTITETPEGVILPEEESKASFGWIALLLGAGAVGTVAYKKWKERK